MDIKYLGHSSFYIKTKNSRLVTDPYDPKIGLKFLKTEADTVTISHHHPDHDFLGQITGEPLVIDWPGEFEKQGVAITGYASYHDKVKGAERGLNTLYKFVTEGVSILHCGDIGLVPDTDFIGQIGQVDVLMIPIGGFYTIDANEAVELIKKVEPSLVIPMHFNRPELDQTTFGKLTSVDEFLGKIGAESAERVNKLSIKQGDFAEEMKVVVMEIGA